MKDFQFHADMPEHWKSKSANKSHAAFTRATLTDWASRGIHCNVTAIVPSQRAPGGAYDAYGAVTFEANSGCAGTQASPEYLRTRTVRIAESLARKLHPQLFEYLDYEPD